jgi:hypothetical protein
MPTPLVNSSDDGLSTQPWIRELTSWCAERNLDLVNVLLDMFQAVGLEVFTTKVTNPFFSEFKRTC